MDELREQLAALAHDAWSGWMHYMFEQGTFTPDGRWTMPAAFVDRWLCQCETPYTALSDDEKESDRAEADRMIKIIRQSGQFARIGKSIIRPAFSIENDDE